MAVTKIATTYHMSDGNREDLLDVITNISPTETPMFSSFGKTKAKNTTHEWLTDSLASAAANSNIEGDDYSFENLTARSRLSNQTQIFVTPVRVSDTQRAVDTAGFEDEYAYQMAKKLKEHARDIEYAIVADSASASGDTATARTLKGVLEWISTNIESGSSSATGEDLTESMFNDCLQDIWDSGGQPQTVYCNGYQKRQISDFSTNTRNVAASEKELIQGVDVWNNRAHLKLGYMLEHPKAFATQWFPHNHSNYVMTMVNYLKGGERIISENVKDVTMDNQQERWLGWLAGIVDGEGTISLQMYHKPNNKIRVVPIVGIVNSHKETLNLCEDIISNVLDIEASHQCRMLKKKGNSPCWQIRIDGYKSVKSFLEGIRPYLVTKADMADVVLEFIESREENRLKRDEKGRIQRTGYSSRECELLLESRRTNYWLAKSLETIRQASNVELDDDIVRTYTERVGAGRKRSSRSVDPEW